MIFLFALFFTLICPISAKIDPAPVPPHIAEAADAPQPRPVHPWAEGLGDPFQREFIIGEVIAPNINLEGIALPNILFRLQDFRYDDIQENRIDGVFPMIEAVYIGRGIQIDGGQILRPPNIVGQDMRNVFQGLYRLYYNGDVNAWLADYHDYIINRLNHLDEQLAQQRYDDSSDDEGYLSDDEKTDNDQDHEKNPIQ